MWSLREAKPVLVCGSGRARLSGDFSLSYARRWQVILFFPGDDDFQ